ncbi:hypothetical protein YC2023_095909 [Brassica napus]
MKQLVILNNKMWSKEIVGEIKLTSFFTKTDVTEQDKESGMVRTLFHAIDMNGNGIVGDDDRLESEPERYKNR